MKLKQFFQFSTVLPMLAIVFVAILSGCDKDEDPGVRPTVTSTDPANNAIGVAVNSKITSVFSVTMNASTASKITLKQGTANVAGTSVVDAASVIFTPSVDLLPNTLYTAMISKTAVSKKGASLSADHTWSFTTGALPDLLKPTVTLANPLNNATGVALNRAIVMTFSEPMDVSTITSSTFTVKQGSTVVSGTVTTTATTATFTPTSNLSSGLVYTATLTTGIKDLSGNALAANVVSNFTTSNTASNLAIVNLGKAGDYVILAKTAINNSSTSAITGDLALSPAATSYITGLALTDATGYATSSQVTGQVFAADMADPTPVNLTTAVENMITAYNDAAGRPSPDFLELGTGNIGGKTLSPGLYKWTTTVTLPSNVVISGGANDVWIFQISGDLTMSAAVNITLTGGAQAKNIFWQVAGQTTIGTTAQFKGIILSMTGITLQTGASINGRALAQTAVILDSNAVTKPN